MVRGKVGYLKGVIVIILLLAIFLFTTLADEILPTIEFVDPTPLNGTTLDDYIPVNISSSDENQHYAFVDFNKSLALWMRMDDVNISGDPTDLSSYSNNGSLEGGTLINSSSGYWGNGSYFDGDGDYIGIPNSASLNISDQITIAGWFNLTALNSYNPIVRNGISIPGDFNEDGYVDSDAEDYAIFFRYFATVGYGAPYPRFDLDGDGLIGTGDFGIYSGYMGQISPLWFVEIRDQSWGSTTSNETKLVFSISGTTTPQIASAKNFTVSNIDVWYHFVAVYNGSSSNLYINGTLDNSIPNTGTIDLTNYSLRIGSNPYTAMTTRYYFNGKIDEVLIFNRALSSTEIKALYNASAIQYQHNFTDLSAGNYTFTGYAVDKAGNKNETETRWRNITAISATIVTNAPTGVEENNATLWGQLLDDGNTLTTCGFWYDTTSGGTSNNQSVGTISEGNTFSYNASSLTAGQLYYFKAWANNSAGFNGTANEKTFLTKPNATTDLTAQANSSTMIYLTWTAGDGTNNTYIERNASGDTVWARGVGTVIYNGSNTSYEDTDLAVNTRYYYQAWSYTNWTYNPTLQQWSDNNDSANNETDALPTITGVIPVNGSTGVSISINIVVNFDKSMNSTSVESNFSIFPSVDGSFIWSNDNQTLTFDSSSNLGYSTTYTVTIYKNASDEAGNTMLNIYIWDFRTTARPSSGGDGGISYTPPSESDSDGDGILDNWDNCRNTYNPDQNDTDEDGIGDVCDEDDDNDGLTDEEEEQLDTDPKNKTNFEEVEISGENNYLVDTDDDGIYDVFYKLSTGLITNVEINEDGTYLIDSNGDGVWDYVYDPAKGTTTSLKEEKKTGTSEEYPWIMIGIIAAAIATIAIISFLYKKEYF